MALKFANNNSLSAITSVPSGVGGGSLNLISTQTASGSSTIDFTSGIDSTYKEYIFKFTDIHPATDNVQFSFQANVSGGSGFNETITSISISYLKAISIGMFFYILYRLLSSYSEGCLLYTSDAADE